MRLLRPGFWLAAAAVLAVSLVAVAPAAHAQTDCSEADKAELRQQITDLTLQIRQASSSTRQVSITDLENQRYAAQARLAACGGHDRLPVVFRSAWTYQNNPAEYSFASVASVSGVGDSFDAAYDRAVEQALEAAHASTTPSGVPNDYYISGFRVTQQQVQNRDDTTSSHCAIVIKRVHYTNHRFTPDRVHEARYSITEVEPGLFRVVYTDVGHC
ncbi:MAG: hypothetical protein OXH78_02420 [Acidimicrobiaceae bacterium]|nr:hypothetical protein [Acidimicrobiaceae bacterium]